MRPGTGGPEPGGLDGNAGREFESNQADTKRRYIRIGSRSLYYKIKERHLYLRLRTRYSNFEEYCQARCGMKRANAGFLIAAADDVAKLMAFDVSEVVLAAARFHRRPCSN